MYQFYFVQKYLTNGIFSKVTRMLIPVDLLNSCGTQVRVGSQSMMDVDMEYYKVRFLDLLKCLWSQ